MSVSVFLMAPISVVILLPLFKTIPWRADRSRFFFHVFCAILLLQVLSISITILTAPRFYYDFLAILLIACFLVLIQFGEMVTVITKLLILASMIISGFLLTMSLSLFLPAIEYPSPLLGLLGKLGLAYICPTNLLSIVFRNSQCNYGPYLKFIEDSSDETLELLIRWADINSGSRNISGLYQLSEDLRAEFERLGAEVELIDLDANSVVDDAGAVTKAPLGRALHVVKRPEVPKRVLLCCHMDTVGRA